VLAVRARGADRRDIDRRAGANAHCADRHVAVEGARGFVTGFRDTAAGEAAALPMIPRTARPSRIWFPASLAKVKMFSIRRWLKANDVCRGPDELGLHRLELISENNLLDLIFEPFPSEAVKRDALVCLVNCLFYLLG
jgi:hypothetical protein